MKNILITGSSGYIGQHLVKLLQENYEVYGIDNRVIDNDFLKDGNFLDIDIRYNIRDFMFSMNDMPEHYDCVIHLAALVRVNESVERPATYYNNNIK